MAVWVQVPLAVLSGTWFDPRLVFLCYEQVQTIYSTHCHSFRHHATQVVRGDLRNHTVYHLRHPAVNILFGETHIAATFQVGVLDSNGADRAQPQRLRTSSMGNRESCFGARRAYRHSVSSGSQCKRSELRIRCQPPNCRFLYRRRQSVGRGCSTNCILVYRHAADDAVLAIVPYHIEAYLRNFGIAVRHRFMPTMVCTQSK